MSKEEAQDTGRGPTDASEGREPASAHLLAYLRALRPLQWAKNLLVFVPILAAHRATEMVPLGRSLAAFAAFCSCASATYLLNDLLDLPADRRHPEKRRRPLASGAASPRAALLLVPVLLTLAFGVAAFLGLRFAAVLLVYLLLSTAYSVRLKRIVMADVIVLAGLYTARLMGGSMATAIPLSFWLLAFSMFLFTSLAIVKRYAELQVLEQQGDVAPYGRGYRVADLEILRVLGVACGGLAVLVLALYVNSEQIRVLYAHPEVVWFLCPLLLYWTGRLWILTHRGQMHHDPVVFALRDPVSWGVLLVAGLIAWGAT